MLLCVSPSARQWLRQLSPFRSRCQRTRGGRPCRVASRGWAPAVIYVDVNNDVEILDSGRKSIKNDTAFVLNFDYQTDWIKLPLQFGSLPLPGNPPKFSFTGQLLPP